MATETAVKRPPTVADLVLDWKILEALLATPEAPALWARHWRLVSQVRRAYARWLVAAGLVCGVVAGLGTVVTGSARRDWFLIVMLFLSAFVIGNMWVRLQQATVAPFIGQPRHRWSRWAGFVLYESVLAGGFFVPAGVTWALAGGVLAALPWWVGAAVERRQRVPAYPSAWLAHLVV